MIFGAKPIYMFGCYNKRKVHSMGKAYPFDEIPARFTSCPFKLVDNKAEIFFPGPIFNSYVISIEDKVSILKSFDDKLTLITEILEKDVLYTFKTISEDDKVREVKLYEFDEFFPGFKSSGKILYENGKCFYVSKFGKGPILMQTNEIKKDVEAMISKIELDEITYVEINNSVERATCTIVKDLKNIKIVEEGNVKGILINCINKKINDQVNVYVKNVYPGSYCFVEDITPGIAQVQLVGKFGNFYKVKFNDFIGECHDKKVSKTMKGMIYDIKGASFKFKQSIDNEEIRTKDYETISVPKKLCVKDEASIKNDQYRAIEFIKTIIEKGQDASDLFMKYIKLIKGNDYLALFYLKYLSDENKITESDVNKVIALTSANFPRIACNSLDNITVVNQIYNKKKTLDGFKILIEHQVDKVKFIKENPEFLSYAIGFIYENMENPRVVVESIIDSSFKCWYEYLKREDKNYKRNLFRRMSKMKFKKNETQKLLKEWLAFEESIGGNVEEVHHLINAKKE